jgi:thiol-disulfide isomerase/thioredoxin
VELRVLLVVGALAAAVALGLLWRARQGRFVAVPVPPGTGADGSGRLTPEDLGAALGRTATFVQLSAEVCTPCRRTAAVLGDLVRERPDDVHVELPAEERLDLVRRFDVLRTPTVLVLDAAGAVRGRFSGAADPAQVRAALATVPVLPAPRSPR